MIKKIFRSEKSISKAKVYRRCSDTLRMIDGLIKSGIIFIGLLLSGLTSAGVHLIKPGDEISIQVIGHPDLTIEKVTVSSKGEVKLQLIKNVEIADLTLDLASEKISKLYEISYLQTANVLVNLITKAEVPTIKIVFVGKIIKPGSFDLAAETDLVSAIASAGGLAKGADQGAVEVKRRGIKKPLRFNYNHILAGEDEDPFLLDGDIVHVLDSFF